MSNLGNWHKSKEAKRRRRIRRVKLCHPCPCGIGPDTHAHNRPDIPPHTPTPWSYEWRTRTIRHGFNVPMSGQNVRFAVHAANQYDALLAALEDLREAVTDVYKSGRIPAEPFIRAGNVIADADRKARI